ncbi:MAG: TonB-dependent siderophore receptor [Cephaloticoccus sp.]|nr:TonB-dependent siderophore receptor [Cephaloticoccus sp.]MCF7761520.1 TonB-dependent siderophore receptor [Cephaloticoccus sp.]
MNTPLIRLGCCASAFLGAWLLVLSPVSALAQEEEIVELSPFEVNTAKDVGYYAGNSISATKTNIPLQKLPMNVQVMTRTFLDDLNATDIESVMAYAASASPATNEPGRFALRGFVNPNPMRNGVDTLSETNFVSTLTLDRIEIVKGPAAILYGITEPGGLINMITKKPLFKQQGSLGLQFGDYSTSRAEIDLTGPISEKIAYRMIAGYSDIGYEVDFAKDETTTIAPSLLFQLAPKTTLLLAMEYQDLKSVPDTGAILKLDDTTNERIGFIQANYYGVPKTFNHMGPDGRKNTETTFLTADFQHRFANDQWAVRAVINKTKTSLDQDTRLGAGAEIKVGGKYGYVRNHVLARLVDRDETVFQGEITGHFDLGGITNRVLLGYEKTAYEQDQKAFRQNNAIAPMNLKDPSSWDFSIPIAPENRSLKPADFFSDQDTWSIYGVHQAELLSGRLNTLLGLRYDVVEASTLDRLVSPPALGSVPTSKSWTPQVGALFALTPTVGVYASYSESFTPNTSVNPDGSLFDPATGEGTDFGLKFNAPDGRFNATLSVFDIKKVNIVRQDGDRRNNDPLGRLWFIASGQERSQGYEADIIMTPVDNYQMTVSYAYIDAYVVSNADAPAEEGNQLGEAPTHNFAWWNKYTFSQGPLNGFYVGAGLTSRSKSKLDSQVVNLTVSYPSYTAVDVVVGYKHEAKKYPWEVAVRLNNATNELYMARNRSYADGRNVQVTAKLHF